MKATMHRFFLALFCLTMTGYVSAETTSLDFDDAILPKGWKADATGGTPASWSIIPGNMNNPGASKVLAITRINDPSRGNFNLYWTPDVTFYNGSLEVTIQANSGSIDQGGGLIWRALNAKNYYITRYNPLERNLRLYYVKNGSRTMLADAPKSGISVGDWFALKVSHHGERISVWLNSEKLIDYSDDTFLQAGGVGLWAKADAMSSFDNFKIQHTK